MHTKNKNIVILYSIIIASLIATLTSCRNGSNVEPQIEDNESATVYVPEFSKQEYEIDSSLDFLVDMFVAGDTTYCISREHTFNSGTKDTLMIFDSATGESSDKELGAPGKYFEYSEGFVRFCNNVLYLYDKNFSDVKEINLQGLYNRCKDDGISLSCDDIEIDDEGRIGIISGQSIIFADSNGELLCVIEQQDNIRTFAKLAVTKAQGWYVICNNTKYNIDIWSIDIGQSGLGVRLDNAPDIYGGQVYFVGQNQAEENSLYIVSGNYIYKYDVALLSYEEVVCLRDYGVEIDNGSGVSIINEDRIRIANRKTNTNGQTDNRVNIEYADIRKIPIDEVKTRKELVMATFSEASVYREQIMDFNRYNKDYYVTVKEYYNRDDYDTAMQSFYNDLITGNGADIFWISDSDIDIENLADKNVVVDMYEFMDGDEELGRNEFIPNVLAAMEYDGKLYALSPDFSLSTMVGKASLLDMYEQWNYSSIKKLFEEHPCERPFFRYSQQRVLETLLYHSLPLFYDNKKGESYFGSQEFADMLVVVADVPEENDYDRSLPELLENNETLLFCTSINNCDTIKTLDTYFGGDIRYAGYPDGSGAPAEIRTYYKMAISSQSDNKAGAWQFVKSYFSEDSQKNTSRFPVIQKYFDDIINNDMAGAGTASGMLMDGVTVELKPMTEQQALLLRELVDKAGHNVRYDVNIYDIVTEDAQGFLSGSKNIAEVQQIINDRVMLYLGE